ncbi:MAG: hypothetical protein JRE23_04460 [Deltaproteobacteria bacterium]|nr:hypothetical protein [Deltaproteobacteria bacterium]
MKKQAKSYSFDAMVRFFIRSYKIPTKRDIDRLMAKIDKLEKTIISLKGPGDTRAKIQKKTSTGSTITTIDTVLGIIKRHRNGVDIPTIKDKSGFDDKAVRNAIFRLTKQNKIMRKSRGIYTVATG